MRTSAAANPVPGFSGSLAPPLDSDLHPAWKPHPRRRACNPAFPIAAARSRPLRGCAASSGRRSGPTTPLLRWKFNEKPPSEATPRVENDGGGAAPPPPRISARKLAAGIWHLRPLDTGDGGCPSGQGESRRVPSGLKPVPGNEEVQLLHSPLCHYLHTNKNKKNGFVSPVSVLSPKYDTNIHKIAGFPSSKMEKATKWDPESSTTSEDVYRFYTRLKLLEDQKLNTISFVSSRQTELEKARAHIIELETERRLEKEKLDEFLKRLAEEKVSWQSREHEKVRSIIEAMKGDLDKERKRRQRIEMVHAQLVNDLSEAKLTAKQLLEDYEKERKACEFLEEACHELAKEVHENEAVIETLKTEVMMCREEVENEKRVLQMAEVWREERVQMKLTDAKLTLEEKYSQLRELKAELEALLAVRTTADLDSVSIRQAELLKQRADAALVDEIKEFSYQPPPASEDIYAIFEELQARQKPGEGNIKPCCDQSPRSHASNINTASAKADILMERTTRQDAHEFLESNYDVEDESDWETVSHAEEQGSSNSHDGSEPSVNDYCKESHASVSESEWKENDDKISNEIMEVSSANSKPRKKVSSIYRLWRSSARDKVEDAKKTSAEAKPGRLSNGRLSNATLASNTGEEYKKLFVEHTNGRVSNGNLSSEVGFGEAGISPRIVGQCSSPESLNPHMARGTKGCIEWPRANQKHNLKAKLMEAGIGSEKFQLRHALGQKI